jgi:Cu(I)/Ag(I) efflux system protein CusF
MNRRLAPSLLAGALVALVLPALVLPALVLPVFAAAPLVGVAGNSSSSQDTDHASHHAQAADATSQGADFVPGEVRRVDLEMRKVTLRHGPIPNLQMPEMTMVFQVRDPAMLRDLKAGDKIRFKADKIDGAFTVTAVEPAR